MGFSIKRDNAVSKNPNTTPEVELEELFVEEFSKASDKASQAEIDKFIASLSISKEMEEVNVTLGMKRPGQVGSFDLYDYRVVGDPKGAPVEGKISVPRAKGHKQGDVVVCQVVTKNTIVVNENEMDSQGEFTHGRKAKRTYLRFTKTSQSGEEFISNAKVHAAARAAGLTGAAVPTEDQE
jgi:hypothetical protein